MNFEIGDKVNFICRGEICTGAILDFGKKAILVEYTTGDRADWRLWVRESELALEKLPIVPRYVADWISHCERWELWHAMDYGIYSMSEDVREWLFKAHDNQELFARAWLDGYEVEQEPLYYIKVIDSYFGYINLNLKTGAYTTSTAEEVVVLKTKFTESEIKNMDTRYWAFAVPVEEVEETK